MSASLLYFCYKIIVVLKEVHAALGQNLVRDLKEARLGQKLDTEVVNCGSILSC